MKSANQQGDKKPKPTVVPKVVGGRGKVKKKRSWLLDGFLLLAGAGVFVSSVYLLLYDNGGTGANHSLQEVGHFSESKNDVRRKVNSGYLWSQISRHEEVYEGDSVFTGDDSEASIDLDGGGNLHISAKSLVVLRTTGGISLDLKYGSMVGKLSGNKPLTITENGKKTELVGSNAEFRIERPADSHSFKIKVVHGQMAIRDATPKAVPEAPKVIHKDETADIVENAPTVIRRNEIKLLAPDDGKSLWLKDQDFVEFKWKSTIEEKQTPKAVIEFSRDSSFKNPFFHAEAAPTSYRLPSKLKSTGDFFWRVRYTNTNNMEPSDSAHLIVYSDLAPNLILPNDHQGFSFSKLDGEKGKDVALSWGDSAGSQHFELQVAGTVGFEKPIIEKKPDKKMEHTGLLQAGTYFWRVRGTNSERINPPWSSVSSFAVQEEISYLPAPQVLKTEYNYEIPRSTLSTAKPTVSITGESLPVTGVGPISWTPVTGATDYDVEVSNQPQFTNSKHIATGGASTFSPPQVKPGSYYYRVKALGLRQIVSSPSNQTVLHVTDAPAELSPLTPTEDHFADQDALENAQHEFTISWAKDPFAAKYELQWGLDDQFKTSKKFVMDDPEYKIKVTQPAEYRARMRVLDQQGNPISDYSGSKTYVYKKVLDKPILPPVASVPPPQPVQPPVPRAPTSAGMPPPILTEPLSDSSVVSLEDSVAFVNLRWKTVKGAKTYEIQLAKDSAFTDVIDSHESNNTAYTVRKPLPQGKVYWRVRASSTKGKSDWSEPFRVTVVYN